MTSVFGLADLGGLPGLRWIHEAVECVSASVATGSSCVALGNPAPNTAFAKGLEISADVCLHNREDLVRRLGLDASLAHDSTDAQVPLAAYAKWGDSCASQLLGEFAFAIWDSRRQRLFCCRDQMGFRPFLYWRDGSRFVFGSDSQTILAVPGVPRKLNRRKLAGTFVYGGHAFYHDETFHAGILSLPLVPG